MKLTNLYKYGMLDRVLVGDNADWQQIYPIDPLLVPLHKYIVGIEVETEQFSMGKYNESVLHGHAGYFWILTTDNSLRNNGIELQMRPASANNLAMALGMLKRINEYMKPQYNDRTGIHVHLNVRDMSVEQLVSLFALYVLYEPLLFNFSGGRQNSVYCVPLRSGQHGLPCLFRGTFGDEQASLFANEAVPHGNKYMALNYVPVAKAGFGTVEFRHMVGTDNVGWIKTWVDLIQCLRHAANIPISKLLPEIFSTTEKTHAAFTEKVFGDLSGILAENHSTLWNCVRDGITTLKQWSICQDDYIHWVEDGKKKSAVPLKFKTNAGRINWEPVARAVPWPEPARNFLVQEAQGGGNIEVNMIFDDPQVVRIPPEIHQFLDIEAAPPPPPRPRRV